MPKHPPLCCNIPFWIVHPCIMYNTRCLNRSISKLCGLCISTGLFWPRLPSSLAVSERLPGCEVWPNSTSKWLRGCGLAFWSTPPALARECEEAPPAPAVECAPVFPVEPAVDVATSRLHVLPAVDVRHPLAALQGAASAGRRGQLWSSSTLSCKRKRTTQALLFTELTTSYMEEIIAGSKLLNGKRELI